MFKLAFGLVRDWPRVAPTLESQFGGRDSEAFMHELRSRSFREFGRNVAQQQICGRSGLSVDFYLLADATIVEVALNLRNGRDELERDILKAIMAQEANFPVSRLLLFAKPGAVARCLQPDMQGIIRWAESAHGLRVSVREFGVESDAILE